MEKKGKQNVVEVKDEASAQIRKVHDDIKFIATYPAQNEAHQVELNEILLMLQYDNVILTSILLLAMNIELTQL
jgi:hypothetical protein